MKRLLDSHLDLGQRQVEREASNTEYFFLQRKAFFVALILMVLIVPINFMLYASGALVLTMIAYSLFLLTIAIVNGIFYYLHFIFPDTKLAAYVSTLGVYLLSIGLILELREPSIFTILFLSYAIIAIYQDMKIANMNSVGLFIVGSFVIFRFPEFFDVGTALSPNTFYIFLFLLIFVALLSVSSFIMIKRKRFFYRQLAQIKEREFKIIDIFFQLQERYFGRSFDYEEYYDQIETFTEEFSRNINVENVFQEKIDILRKMRNSSKNELLSEYSSYTLEELHELEQLELSVVKKMPRIAFKVSQSQYIHVSKKDVFAEKQYSTLNHKTDDLEIKVVAFSVFYSLLKMNTPISKKMTDEEIIRILSSEEFQQIVPLEILSVYIRYKDLFADIIADTLEIGDSS